MWPTPSRRFRARYTDAIRKAGQDTAGVFSACEYISRTTGEAWRKEGFAAGQLAAKKAADDPDDPGEDKRAEVTTSRQASRRNRRPRKSVFRKGVAMDMPSSDAELAALRAQVKAMATRLAELENMRGRRMVPAPPVGAGSRS
jgi:hypothetical protein